MALALAFAAPDLARAGSSPRIVRALLRGANAPQGVATEVVLPPGWQPGEPVLLMVFLHDGWGSESSFRTNDLAAIAIRMMQEGAIPPVIIASPRHKGTFIVDGKRGRMESFVAHDLVPALEREFPGAGGATERRSVWGISMGGYGALKMALRDAGVYRKVAALTPWVQPLSWNSHERNRTLRSRWLLEPVFGHFREESCFEGNEILAVAAAADPAAVPPIYVRTGSRDKWEAGAQELVALLRERGIAVDYASIPGAKHGWADWRRATPAVLEFLTK